MTRRYVLAAVALVAVFGVVPPAHAHSGDPNVFARIDAITPGLSGVTIEVRSGIADQLLVVNTTDTLLEVLDTKGVPFLRIRRAGVEANYASADWYLSNSPLGLAQQPRTPKKEDWRLIARTGSWGWFDHRLHDRARPLTPELRAARSTVRLADWTVPMRYGGRPVTVTGHVEYRPVLGAIRSKVEHVPNGVSVDVLDGKVPGLFLRPSGKASVFVEGIAGEAFALVSPQGAMVNASSETWQEDQRLRGKPPGSTPADPTAIHWQQTGGTTLTWLDRRLAYAPGVPPDDVIRSGRPTTLVEWTVPVSVGGKKGAISGTTDWQPGTPRDTSGSPVLYVAAAVAVVAVLAGIRLRAKRR
jgi:hypothetical protein